MPDKAVHGFKRIRNAIKYSYKGLTSAFKNEAAFREELLLAVIFISSAFYFEVTDVERVLLVTSVLLVLVVELINSAIEAVVDRVGEDFHELSGRAKDMGSAAVFITILLAVYVWIEIIII
ncbi:diacylglycerol kinase [uncultured Vibrio sp.]|uniref:diacylglycerol kinase n=1 Tax=uncultured Vibrio sp. TaxID=114054 RepID=UPI0009138A12|nr:diacylglycerol kinase [uncultured Vibrio sp.]OIQ24356.1 MAG: diacylglycerol kinase [Vibrio sp. MedPE-SWchi]